MSQLQDLYQELIVDHSKNPRNKGKLDDCSSSAEGYNPLCGDRIHLYLKVDENDVIRDVKFEGSGCAISTASASIMSQTLKGQTRKQAEVLFETFHYMLTGPKDPAHHAPKLGKLAVFAGVSEFPARVKCATLAWHTMRNALHGQKDPAKTE
jgi:nitrogen fixation NifU-like protein